MKSTQLSIFSSLACLLLVGVTAQAKDAQETGQLARAVQPFVDSNALAGAVMLVATKDRILTIEKVGFADVTKKEPIRKNSMFWIASQSKGMTAAAVMMLVDEGKIALDDPVEKYLPEFKGQMVIAERSEDHLLLKKPTHPITIRNVLSHTSGLPFSSPMETPTLDGLRLRDAVRSYAMLPLQFQPDTKYQYSNAGINTAARIIEVITRQSYEDFMQKRLFDPLGMTDTTFWLNADQTHRLAKSYRPNAKKDDLVETPIGQLIYPLSDRKRQPMPAGGLFSTATDVARFCQVLLNGGELNGRRYLSEKAVKEMTKRQTAKDIPQDYGFGLSTGGGNYGHGGAHATNMWVDVNRGLITVWMVQHAGFPKNGNQSQGVFKKQAYEVYGK